MNNKTTNTFGVKFITKPIKNKPEEHNIYARITIDKKRLEISLKQIVNPLIWDCSAGCLKGNKELARQINPYIEEVRYKLTEFYRQLQRENKTITAEAIKSPFLGEDKILNTLCTLMEYPNVNLKSVLQPGTLKNYFTTIRYVKLFLKHQFRIEDMNLNELNYQFITEFEVFLRTTKPLEPSNPLQNNGIMKHIERLRKMVTMAVKMEWIPKDPFRRYKLHFQKTEREFLTTGELATIENISFKNIKLDRGRDLFVSSCYTGLSYIDLVNLSHLNTCIGLMKNNR